MKYRTLAGEEVSQLGFGAMRLPKKAGQVDEAESIRLIREALDRGINYVDTAWGYHGGVSEVIVGKALQGAYRQKAFVATKSPVWLINSEADFELYFTKQLERLGLDYIDFYLLHTLNEKFWASCQKFKALEFCERMKQAGKLRHYGFSFHDDLPCFKKIVDAHNWEFCQIQYNYLDRNYQAGLEGLLYARNKNIDVIIMEPLRGGNLAGPLPQQVLDLWQGAKTQRSAVDWALRWIWHRQDVALVLSGMSNQEQLDENLLIAGQAGAASLTDEELAMIDETEQLMRTIIKVGCTNCRYCLPCPARVDIPRNFTLWNEYYMFGKTERARDKYSWQENSSKADQCTACGVCLSRCPQAIAIPDQLKLLIADFTA